MKTRSFPILRILLFFLILFALLRVCSRIFTPKSNRDWAEYQAAAFYGEKPGTVDVFFLGDSVAAEGISPMELWNTHGITSVVSAGPWFSLCKSYYALKNILERYTPRLIVLETDSLFAKENTSQLKSTLQTILKEYFPVLRYHDRWKKLSAEDLACTPEGNWRSPTKGYNYSHEVQPWPGGEYRIYSDDVASVSLLDRYYLDQIRLLCSKHSVPLLLLQMPTAATWRYPAHNAVKEYSEQHDIPFLDLNPEYETYGLDWSTDTRDEGNHLNYSGARKCTLYLGDYLTSRYQLPDHRQEAGYELWHADWKLYQNITGSTDS